MKITTLLFALLCGLFASAVTAEAARPPNVIVFLIDDLGWTDAGCYGSDLYETPHIDRLAAEGMKFTDAYSACTVCSPTRAALMTGMYPGRLHLTDWINGHWEHMNAERRSRHPLMPPDWMQKLEHRHTTIAEALREAGYKTAHVGKWHLTPRSDDPAVVAPYYPEHHGFDINIAGNQWGAPRSYYWPYRGNNSPGGLRNGIANFPDEEKTKDKYLSDMLADEAVKIIERWHDQPFFLYFPHYAVHRPTQGRKDLAEKYAAKITPDHRHRDAHYAAMIESVDHSVGRVRATLERLGIAEDTVIIYTSDNGGLSTERGGPTDNTPLRAGKGSPYEGGVRVPAIVSWPGTVTPGSVCDEPVITCDLYPTILEITGATGNAKHNASVDGVSLLPVFQNPEESLGREAIYWHYPHFHPGGSPPYSAIRAGSWRLVEFYDESADSGRVELYNLSDDIGEQHDLAESNPEKRDELSALLHRWREEVDAQPPRRNPGFRG